MSVFVFVVNNLNVTRNTKFTVVTLIKLHMSINGPKFKKNDLNGPKFKKDDLTLLREGSLNIPLREG